MRTLSKAAEEQIIEAIKKAVSLVDDEGLSPTAAIEKVAREQQWSPHTIRFASSAYNTGRQTAQRETASSVLDKFAAFPLADADAVIQNMWPQEEKQASDGIKPTSVADEYRKPPVFLEVRKHSEKLAALRATTEKRAGIQGPAGPQGPKGETIFDAFNRKAQLKLAAEEARHQASVAYDRLLNSMDKLAGYFRKAARDRRSFAETETAVSANFGAHGQRLMDWVYGRNGMKEARAGEVKFAELVEYSNTREPYNIVQACIDLAKNVAEKRAAETQTRQAFEMHNRSKIACYNRQPDKNCRWTLLGEKEAGLGQAITGGLVGAGAESALGKILGTKEDNDASTADALQELEDPSHDAKMRQIRTQAMLADMMNDEVIGSYDPDKVSQAYNQISQLAPRTAQQPFAMRSLLRRSLQGNVEPFEAKEVTDIEKTLKDTEGSTSGAPSTKIIGNASNKSIF